eukprot:TRINITY_DN12547_c0_g1_i3.p1 TRINITY_DN12547_c0_g1~~TRINITY_DN12547_c0_g1_i3.p1  ORF type:complete len:198 (-),score=72.73 TRINITY_DN12547_c0_g1_i3:51-644(-)
MNTFQSMTRKEISMLQNRMAYIEQLVEKISTALDNSQKMFATWRPEEQTPALTPGLATKAKKADDLWSKVSEYIKARRYNEVYSWILGKNDDAQLVRLMGKTGVVIEQLDGQNVEYLLGRAVDLVKAREFVDLLVGWVVAAVDRRVKMSLNTQGTIVETLGDLLELEGEEYQLDELQISEVNRAYNLLKMSLSSLNK